MSWLTFSFPVNNLKVCIKSPHNLLSSMLNNFNLSYLSSYIKSFSPHSLVALLSTFSNNNIFYLLYQVPRRRWTSGVAWGSPCPRGGCWCRSVYEGRSSESGVSSLPVGPIPPGRRDSLSLPTLSVSRAPRCRASPACCCRSWTLPTEHSVASEEIPAQGMKCQ